MLHPPACTAASVRHVKRRQGFFLSASCLLPCSCCAFPHWDPATSRCSAALYRTQAHGSLSSATVLLTSAPPNEDMAQLYRLAGYGEGTVPPAVSRSMRLAKIVGLGRTRARCMDMAHAHAARASTWHHVAPEQRHGDAPAANEAADVYAFGVLLSELWYMRPAAAIVQAHDGSLGNLLRTEHWRMSPLASLQLSSPAGHASPHGSSAGGSGEVPRGLLGGAGGAAARWPLAPPPAAAAHLGSSQQMVLMMEDTTRASLSPSGSSQPTALVHSPDILRSSSPAVPMLQHASQGSDDHDQAAGDGVHGGDGFSSGRSSGRSSGDFSLDEPSSSREGDGGLAPMPAPLHALVERCLSLHAPQRPSFAQLQAWIKDLLEVCSHPPAPPHDQGQ